MKTTMIAPQPKTKHGPRTHHVETSRQHAGQIVTPHVEAWYAGSAKGGARRYVVLACWYDAADQIYSAAEEFAGDFWEATKWLSTRGIVCDIDAA